MSGELISDGEIHDRDMGWLRSADVVVAEATVPSLEVGYEIAQAPALGQPLLVLFRPRARPGSPALRDGRRSPGRRAPGVRDPGDLQEALQASFDRLRQ